MALTIPSGFPTATEIKSAIQSVRGSGATIPTVTDEQIAAARQWAYNTIFAALKGRGYSQADTDAWDFLADFGRDLTLWKIWRERIGSNQDGGKDVEALPKHWDRRDDLLTVTITVDGETVDLDDSQADAGYGKVTFDGTETFNLETEF